MSVKYSTALSAITQAFESPAGTPGSARSKHSEPLICWERMAEYVGDDHETQLQVVRLCLHALEARLPRLRTAISRANHKAVGKIAHDLRGSLGMLGLPELVSLSEQIEYEYSSLGERRWLRCCQKFYELLKRVDADLQQLHAA